MSSLIRDLKEGIIVLSDPVYFHVVVKAIVRSTPRSEWSGQLHVESRLLLILYRFNEMKSKK